MQFCKSHIPPFFKQQKWLILGQKVEFMLNVTMNWREVTILQVDLFYKKAILQKSLF